MRPGLIRAEHDLTFYISSELSLKLIADSDDQVNQSLLTYLDSFLPNVRAIWSGSEFPELLNKLDEKDVP